MTRRFSLTLFLSLLLCVYPCLSPVFANPEAETIILVANEEYVGEIEHKKTRYLIVTLTNLAAEASTCRIDFYRERVQLGTDRVGPVEYRTFTLEKQNETQRRVWTTLSFDEFTLNVAAGKIKITVEKPLQLR